MKFTALPKVNRLAKPLQKALDSGKVLCKSGRFDDPLAAGQTAFHLFDPGAATRCTVLFHGTGNDALFCWESLILKLLASGRAVFAFDLPGHGQNSSTELSEASFANCGHALPEVLATLLPEVQAFEGVAYSLGAWAALRAPIAWQKLVLLALPESVTISRAFLWEESLSFVRPIFWRELLRYGWSARFPAFGPIRRQSFPLRLSTSAGTDYLDFVGKLVRARRLPTLLQEQAAPVLMIKGQRDFLARSDLRAEEAVVAGANHFLLPLYPKTQDLILDFLTSPQRPAAN